MWKRWALWVGMTCFLSCGMAVAIPERSVDFTDFDTYQGVFSQEEIQTKIQRYLEKDPQIRKYYRMTEKAFYIGDLSADQIDYVLHFSQKGKSSYLVERKHGLQGRRIAIDPGHFGGVYAELEKRCIKVSAQEAGGNYPISFD
jgi:hypothetical protein